MKRSNITAVLVLLASFLFVDIASGQLELRTWTSAGGKFSVDAQLEAVADGIVSLKRNDDGTTIKVELAKLCEADRKYVQSAIANQKARKPRHTVEGYMSIGIPEGYKWKVEREWEQNGVYSFLMVARNPNTLDFISLNVNFIAIEDNRIRKGKAESNFNSAVRSFKKMGYTNIKLRPPKIGNEVPDLVEAGLTAIDGDKDQAFIYFATKFEKYYTYAFQAHATTQASSKELAKFFSTLKEIEPKPKRHLDERLGVSIEIP